MIVSFGNRLARDLVELQESKDSRSFPNQLLVSTRKKLAMVHAAKQLSDLKVPPGNRLEGMSGKRKGYYSIRINDQWRVVFRFENGNASEVSVEDYH